MRESLLRSWLNRSQFSQGHLTQRRRWATRWTWIMVAVDSMTLAWMLAAGQWLDDRHNLLSIATWGGHHRIVAALVACALVVLAVLAPITAGFTEGTQLQSAVLIAASVVSVVAVGGVMGLTLPLAVIGLGVGLLGRRLR